VFSGASDTNFVPGRENIRYARDRAFFRYGLRRADAIVLQSARQRILLSQHHGREGRIIRSCYQAPAAAPIAQPGGIVLWVGTIREVKRPDMFVEIARLLPEVRFRLVGGPTEGDVAMQARFERLKSLATDIPNLELAGFVPFAEVEKHFDQASILVSTSSNEGFPNTFLQAWARGIPVVSTFDAGTADTGGELPFEFAHTAAEAALKIRRLTSDHEYWRKRSLFSQAYFLRHHSVESAIRDYLSLFETLLNGHVK
jgi:glycosyltransferase involved in cell wall biosynthesis